MKNSAFLLCSLIIFVFVINLTQQTSGSEATLKNVVFQQYGKPFSVNPNQIPTYFYEHGQYFKGYFEVYFSETSELEGNYMFLKESCPYIRNTPAVAVSNHLSKQTCFTFNLTSLSLPLGKTEQIKFKVYPQTRLNIDPFSVRMYTYEKKKTETDMYSFTPLFPLSDDSSSTLGPWEFTIDINQYLNSKVNFIFFAYDDLVMEFGHSVYLNYPRQVFFVDEHANRLSLIYNNAKVIDPASNNLPYVNVTKSNTKIDILDGYITVSQFLITRNNVDTLSMDESRVMLFHLKPTVSGKTIDPTSLKCAYSFADSNFKQLFMDPTSVIVGIDQGYKIVCMQRITQPIYQFSVIGIPHDYNFAYIDSDIKVSPISTIVENFYFSFNPNTTLSGTYRVTRSIDYTKVPLAETIQQPLTKYQTIKIKFDELSIGPTPNPEYNIVNIQVENVISNEMNIDPYSFKVFELNQDKTKFELVGKDVTLFNRVSIDLDLGKILSSDTKTKVYTIAYYENTEEKVGNRVYVHYPREITFNPRPLLSLNMEFNMFSGYYDDSFVYSNRPYFTLYPFTPNSTELVSDWTVVYGTIQENGNNLENYGFDETRTFYMSYDYEQFDENGNFIPIKLTDLTCIFLSRETNFRQPEESIAGVYLNDEKRQVSIKCLDDISTETFAFVLAAKKFRPTISQVTFNSDIITSPSVYNRVDMTQFGLDDDIMTISLNPNSRSSGTFRIVKDTRRYGEYTIPETHLEPIQMIGSILFEFNMTIFSNSHIDTQVYFNYQKNTNLFNLDPYSYKFFSIDDENQAFNWLDCNDEPTRKSWNTKIDLSLLSNGKFKIAIFAYTNIIGQFGTFYAINYDRLLKYGPQIEQAIFNFSSPSFPEDPSTKGVMRFAAQQGNPSTESIIGKDLVIVKVISIVQSIRKDVTTIRSFTYTNDLKDLNGKPIHDLLSMQCLYLASGKTIFGNTPTIRNESSIYTLECSDAIEYELYDWIIVAKETPTPFISIPKPSPTLNPKVSSSHNYHNDSVDNTSTIILSCIIALLLCVIIVLVVLLIYCSMIRKKKNNSSGEHERIFNFEETGNRYSSNL